VRRGEGNGSQAWGSERSLIGLAGGFGQSGWNAHLGVRIRPLQVERVVFQYLYRAGASRILAVACLHTVELAVAQRWARVAVDAAARHEGSQATACGLAQGFSIPRQVLLQ